jgi:hypothetical protein
MQVDNIRDINEAANTHMGNTEVMKSTNQNDSSGGKISPDNFIRQNREIIDTRNMSNSQIERRSV